MVKGRNQVTLNKWLGKFKSRCLLLRREYLCPTFPSFRGIRHGRGVIAGRCPKSLSPVSGGQAGAKGSRNSPWVIFCFLLVFRPTASSRLSPLWAPGSRAFSTLYALGTQDSSRGTHFFAESGLSGLLNLSRPSAASPRPQPQPHPERLWGAGRGPGRQRNAMVNNRLWMARAPALCVPLRTPDRQPHEAHRGGDQPGVDPVAVQGEAGGRGERHPVLRHPDRDLQGGGRGHHVEGQEGEMEGWVELQVEGPHGRGIADHLIEAAGFLDRPRRGREACTLDIDLARLRPLPEVAEAESILTEPVVWAWSVPRKSDTRKRAARSGEGTRKALCRRPFRAERRFWISSRVSIWIEDRDSITAWPRARSSSRFPTIWE